MKLRHETAGQEELGQGHGQGTEGPGLMAGGVRTKYEMHEKNEIDASREVGAEPGSGLAAGGVRTKYEMHEKNEIDASREVVAEPGSGLAAGGVQTKYEMHEKNEIDAPREVVAEPGTVPGLEKEVLFAGTPASWPAMRVKREGSPQGTVAAAAVAAGAEVIGAIAEEAASDGSQPTARSGPEFPETALHGPLGDLVRTILPCTEADPAALLVQLLAGVGNLIGPSPYFVADSARHRGNLFAIVTGRTAKARKGTSWQQVRHVLQDLDADWLAKRVKSGVVSGEGIAQVFEPGGDRRLLLLEGEFAQVLQVIRREGSTVSALLRQAWDGQRIAVLRRKDSVEVDDAHISMIGHITLAELHRLLAGVEVSNGLANRCLWVHADRSKLLPEGGSVPDTTAHLQELRRAIRSARVRNELRRDENARQLWREIYGRLSEPPAGRAGEVLSRSEAQVMRLALLYALMDGASTIAYDHLTAALALWDYCEASAMFIFTAEEINPRAARVLAALKDGPMSLSGLNALFHRNLSQQALKQLLSELGPLVEVYGGGSREDPTRWVRARKRAV
ncbi:DUF3987 domain-containing protein [Verrucomicrobium sp. BvORR106]|uniref:DUF3987 domain-containing protein n=1 Tax=Verrucomicrobium sp. BvORR106 TaxID=1403819 RepID=UPI002240F61F|nr:DUF3987 domain-containing protein [Verrucomicrobium sp. BvORR106]